MTGATGRERRSHGISLLIPTRNAELTVELCIRSFADFPDEIIVVDNGSTDSTREILRELEAEYDHLSFYDRPTLADLYHNRQFAFFMSRFDWICRLDSDYVAYTSGAWDIMGLRKRILETEYTAPPTAFRVRQFSLARDCNTLARNRSRIPENRGKYVPGGWSELAARIVQWHPGMKFARIEQRWEGVAGQDELASLTLDRPYWMHCDFKRPLDCLFRSERTNWREHGDFHTYPRLEDYVRAVVPGKYGTPDLEEAAAVYMAREFDPWVRPYDPETMPPYPETIVRAATGELRLISGSTVSGVLPKMPPHSCESWKARLELIRSDQYMATVHGVALQLGDEFVSEKMRAVLEQGDYENHEVRILREVLNPEDRYLELGAGIGVTAIVAAGMLERPPVVYEANPVLCEYLRLNSGFNGATVTVHNGAVAQGGSVDFHIHEHFWSSSTLPKEGTLKKVSVPAFGLQELLDAHRPTFLLCDIEGGEVEAFQRVDLSCLNRICLEIHNHYVGDPQTTRTLMRIAEQGFCIDFRRSAGKVFLFYRPTP